MHRKISLRKKSRKHRPRSTTRRFKFRFKHNKWIDIPLVHSLRPPFTSSGGGNLTKSAQSFDECYTELNANNFDDNFLENIHEKDLIPFEETKDMTNGGNNEIFFYNAINGLCAGQNAPPLVIRRLRTVLHTANQKRVIDLHKQEMRILAQLAGKHLVPILYMYGTMVINRGCGYFPTVPFAIMERFDTNLGNFLTNRDPFILPTNRPIREHSIHAMMDLYWRLAHESICNLDLRTDNVVMSHDASRFALIDLDPQYNLSISCYQQFLDKRNVSFTTTAFLPNILFRLMAHVAIHNYSWMDHQASTKKQKLNQQQTYLSYTHKYVYHNILDTNPSANANNRLYYEELYLLFRLFMDRNGDCREEEDDATNPPIFEPVPSEYNDVDDTHRLRPPYTSAYFRMEYGRKQFARVFKTDCALRNRFLYYNVPPISPPQDVPGLDVGAPQSPEGSPSMEHTLKRPRL